MPIIDHNYGRIPVAFPDAPYASNGMFVAYIVSYLPDSPEHRAVRRINLRKQLRWWRLMTDVAVTVLASGWTAQEVAAEGELKLLLARGGRVISIPGQSLIENRIVCLSLFYDSDVPWGIMMDDDAILYHSPRHNSGGAFFSEMAANGAAAYGDVDVFYPINPAKLPGQNQIWAEAPAFYQTRHVFEANYDLKGSLFVVRNFRLDGRKAVLPPPDHTLHGEDTLFAIEAVANGCTVYRCENMVLKEFSGPSHFKHAPEVMKVGNEAIAARYAAQGLRMHGEGKRSHLLDRTKFVELHLRGRPRRVVVTKPDQA
ncbi:hypothetical protein [Aliihoeflea sp. 2WW]|uniref:hypothetical protein n=1 Tax=Aliihoeflea sp. 2WW TaxID=1381123 RepID=UPI0004672EEE|nr:hypothetical protein [Aliihoeflea sp. 2WW]